MHRGAPAGGFADQLGRRDAVLMPWSIDEARLTRCELSSSSQIDTTVQGKGSRSQLRCRPHSGLDGIRSRPDGSDITEIRYHVTFASLTDNLGCQGNTNYPPAFELLRDDS